MLRIELSALSAQELKRLLDMARARNQTALADQLIAELESRPMRAEDWSPLPMNYARPPEMAAEPEFAPPRRNGVMAATAVVAAFVSAAVTWGLSVPPPQPAAAPEAPRAAVVLASLAPVGAPVGFSEAPPPVPEADVADPQPTRLASAPTSPTRAGRNPCYSLPTAAERLVCGYPGLAAQDRQLKAVYERAIAAGADRRDLDRTQAQWRSGSENLSDRAQLSERYARRIRELEAAASAAPPPPPPEDPPF